MMARTEASRAVRAAASAVIDPATGLSLGELDLVRDVDTRRGGTTVRVALPLADGSQADHVRASVTEAADGVLGDAKAVDVAIEPMSVDARASLGRELRHRHRRPGAIGSTTSVYAIGSGKGGVGKSTVSANVAVALAQQGQRVGILDADVWGYSMPQLMGVREAPVALSGIMLPVVAHGTRLMSTGFFVDDAEPIVWRGPMLQKALEQFLDDVYWGGLDSLVIDLPPGTGDVSLSIMQMLPSAAMVVVTTPQAAAENVAARVGRMAADARMPVLGVVENMTATVCPGCGDEVATLGAGGGERLARRLGVDLLAQIPTDPSIATGGDAGLPVVVADPTSRPAMRLRDLARDLPPTRTSLVGKSLPLFA